VWKAEILNLFVETLYRDIRCEVVKDDEGGLELTASEKY
jgi:hypothetical protein